MMYGRSWFIRLALGGLLVCSAQAWGQLTILGSQYRTDRMFPEYLPFWQDEGITVPPEIYQAQGCSIHVYVRNSTASPVTIQDVHLQGESLLNSLVFVQQVASRIPASIFFASLSPAQLQTLLAAGEPVWYAADPPTLPPGGVGQAIIRMRGIPQYPTLHVNVQHAGGAAGTIVSVNPDQPRVAGVSFSPDLRQVYLYWRHALPGMSPVRVLLDGVDVTASTVSAADAALGLSPTVLTLAQPLAVGSYHVFQAEFADGQTASAGLRAWNDEFGYGMWGAAPGTDGNFQVARDYINDITNHMINLQVQTLGSQAVQSFLKTAEGQQFAAQRGLRFVIDQHQKWAVMDPFLFFIRDEPDAADYRITDLPEHRKISSLAQWCSRHAETLRSAQPGKLTMLNIDGTYKPQNWYLYGQVPDVFATDPYYQARLRNALWSKPQNIPLYAKADYIYAVSRTAQASCEPNPLHVILYACSFVDNTLGKTFPFPTPQCKRIEVYYALAAGAKGLSYWWYSPSPPSRGVGAGRLQGDQAAQKLWKEMGLVGAEVRTAGPLLVSSTPTDLPLQASAGVWARTLVSGLDTAVLLAVNDQYYNDEAGTHFTPVENASVTMHVPTWIGSPQVFEITSRGLFDVASSQVGGQMTVSLGRLALTRMIVITADPQLRSTIQARYDQQFRAKVLALVPPAKADLDGDGDVDADDFGILQACLTGRDVPQTNPACLPARLDADSDVDEDDVAAFLQCLSGPNIPVETACLN